MFRFFLIASIMSMVYAKEYAYFGNNLVEFDDTPAHISLPYPYQEPKVVNPVRYDVSAIQPSRTTHIVESQELVSFSLLGVICSFASNVFGFIKKVIYNIISSLPSLIFCGFSLLGVCNNTPICKYFDVDPLPYYNEVTSFINTERFKRAADFVETAIKRYRSLQEE